ncbi:hypothetical protein [Dictyobacter formicarum]|nr:hypothetical protein [Dictyobacter formicarum]
MLDPDALCGSLHFLAHTVWLIDEYIPLWSHGRYRYNNQSYFW